MKKKLILGVAGAVILTWAGASLVGVVINLTSYKPVVEAMQARFPELLVQGAAGYEGRPPHISIRVYGVTDPAEQDEIHGWLTSWNDQHEGGPITLRIYKNRGDPFPATTEEIAPRTK